jgi:minor extracellular protease Epr
MLLLFISSPCLAKSIKILIIDTGIGKHEKLKKYLPSDIEGNPNYIDTHGHGTHVAGIVAYGNLNKPTPVCQDVIIHSCKFYDTNHDKVSGDKTKECWKKALNEHYDVINYSAGGGLEPSEFFVIRSLLRSGTVIIVAAGNDSRDLKNSEYYPAQYILNRDMPKTFHVVGSIDYNGKISKFSNYSNKIEYEYGNTIVSLGATKGYTVMNGSSQATALRTHKMILELCEKNKK